ncbi:MAG: hypothetical protein V1888_03310 [archaeon]
MEENDFQERQNQVFANLNQSLTYLALVKNADNVGDNKRREFFIEQLLESLDGAYYGFPYLNMF